MDCNNRNHAMDLLIWGGCYSCRKVFALGTDQEVFARAEKMRQDFAMSGIKL